MILEHCGSVLLDLAGLDEPFQSEGRAAHWFGVFSFCQLWNGEQGLFPCNLLSGCCFCSRKERIVSVVSILGSSPIKNRFFFFLLVHEELLPGKGIVRWLEFSSPVCFACLIVCKLFFMMC
ncbi:hypothetical protein B296_00057164 [Ensete ventricosum]|uniref:Uncharacterized protein n=1 Tax=Ensete ventricosum TaxID=4639 RepID=A0A426XL26_ENSVE|nr:hypothetical protein B296_00057164 [Ensete ventricosum]